MLCGVHELRPDSRFCLYDPPSSPPSVADCPWPLMTFQRGAVDQSWRLFPAAAAIATNPFQVQQTTTRVFNRWVSRVTGSAFIPFRSSAAASSADVTPANFLAQDLLRFHRDRQHIASSMLPPAAETEQREGARETAEVVKVSESVGVEHTHKEQLVNGADLRELEKFATSFKARRIRLGFTQTNVGRWQQ